MNKDSQNTCLNKKSILKFIFKTVIAIFCISIIGIVGLYALLEWSIGGTYYTDFNKERIAQMENVFGIIVTDDIKLEEYSENNGWDGDRMLTLKTDDYLNFMENNISGTIKNYEEYDDRNTVAHFQYSKENYATVSVRVYQFFDNSDYEIYLWIS